MAKEINNGRRRQRMNAWLTGLLVILVLVQGNRLARKHLGLVRDITEDQLFLPSEVGVRMLGELEDTLQVKAFFTGDVKSGSVQIAKRRLIDQLEEFARVANGRMEVSYVDPNDSTEARVEAEHLGILPRPVGVDQGVSKVYQDIWLGLALRYRGKESVLRFVVPQTLESSFLPALRRVTRASLPCVGFVTGDGRNLDERFSDLRTVLSEHYELLEVLDLALGTPVADAVDVLVVAQPTNFHPRVAFEIDRFVQRGGRALLLLDGVQVDVAGQAVYPIPTGLEGLLEAWGVTQQSGIIWDRAAHNVMLPNTGDGRAPERIDYPFWPQVLKDNFNAELPVTAALGSANLYWAQELSTQSIPGLESDDLFWTSSEAWSMPYTEPGIYLRSALPAIAARVSPADAHQRTLGVTLNGRFPSPFAEGVPDPVNPIAMVVYEAAVRRALEAGLEPPPLNVTLSQQSIQNAEVESQVVIIGDADWAAGNFFKQANQLLFINLVDWLALEDDLLALRSRRPIERPIANFLEEERAKIGLKGDPETLDVFESRTLATYEKLAADDASQRRWILMLKTTGGALLAAFLLGMLWRFSLGRGPLGPSSRTSSSEQQV